MPIQNFSLFQRMTQFCRTKVPENILIDLNPIKDNDEAVKAYGIKLCVEMCQILSKNGIPGYHFYTLNLETAVLAVLRELNIEQSATARRYCFSEISLLLNMNAV